jgi:hypothetical protein
MGQTTQFKALWGLGFFACIVVIFWLNSAWAAADAWLWGAYPATALLMLGAIVCIGVTLNRRVAGLIIDNRNRMSLSKLQMLAWTVVVVSALTVSAAYNLRNGFPAGGNPLQIGIPSELLFAMGIAAASFVATPTVLALKAQETPTAADVSDAQAAVKAGATLQAVGKVHGRSDPAAAEWADLFRGDEVGTADTPDLSKIQQFAITLLLLGIYSGQVIQHFLWLSPKVTTGITTLPLLGSQFIVLMGISHASYLVYKAAPHSDSAPAPSSASAT